MSKRPLLASSSTLTGIHGLLEEFYAGTRYTILDDGRVQRVSDGYIPPLIIRKQGKRYRMELDA